jgi:carbamoyltransferase
VNESNGWYYKLLVELKNLTGHGVVVNTSLNCQGAPLINTPIEALSFHHQYKPDASFIGDEMYVS